MLTPPRETAHIGPVFEISVLKGCLKCFCYGVLHQFAAGFSSFIHFPQPAVLFQSLGWKIKSQDWMQYPRMPRINHEHNQSTWHMAVTPWPQNVCSLRISELGSQLVRSSILSGMTDLKIYRKCVGILSTGSDSLIMCHSPYLHYHALPWRKLEVERNLFS